jgi:hypothetical protein
MTGGYDYETTDDDDGKIRCPTPQCPGYWSDLWEYRLDDGKFTDEKCDYCEATIRITACISVDYFARKVADEVEITPLTKLYMK